VFSSRGTDRYEERGQGYRDVEKVGKHCIRDWVCRPYAQSPDWRSRLLFWGALP